MLRNPRILIVDDHPTNIAILEEILGKYYTLKTAACGEEALTIALDFKPALILLDIMMPGIGGYETCRRIRTHPALRHIKIIMVSARALVTERLQGYEAGAETISPSPLMKRNLWQKCGSTCASDPLRKWSNSRRMSSHFSGMKRAHR